MMEPKYKSFKELEESEDVTAAELNDTLKNYADSGAAILARVVIALIKRVTLNNTDKVQLLKNAEYGARKQALMNQDKAADEYDTVVDFLKS